MVGAYKVGDNPAELAFDGQNIWVTNYGSHSVSKLRASDGSVIGTYPVGKFPRGIVFDKTNIWVTAYGDNKVTKLRASDGSVVGTYNVGRDPAEITFDGTNIWVVNTFSNNVTKETLLSFEPVTAQLSAHFQSITHHSRLREQASNSGSKLKDVLTDYRKPSGLPRRTSRIIELARR